MKAKGWLAAGLLVLGAAACGSNPAGPTHAGGPLMDGGGLMGSGTRADPPPSGGADATPPDSARG